VDLSKLKTDDEMTKGAWVTIAPGCRVKVAYTNSKSYRKELGKELRPFRTVLRRTGDYDSIPEADQDAIAIKMLVDHTIFDWEGVQLPDESDKDKKLVDVPFSRDVAIRVLTDYPEFRQLIEEEAAKMANFRAEEQVADEKNLQTASAGS
jgi:hypothetical protein